MRHSGLAAALLLLLASGSGAHAWPDGDGGDALALVQRGLDTANDEKPGFWKLNLPKASMLRSRHDRQTTAPLAPTAPPASCDGMERAQIKRTVKALATGGSLLASVCHTALAGESCYTDVHSAMTEGIKKRPGWYPGLTESSSFEEFQRFFYTNGYKNCYRPCQTQPTENLHREVRDDMFTDLPLACSANMTTDKSINYEQFAQCLQSFLHLSPACSECGAKLLKSFAGPDVFNTGCLPRCMPAAAACRTTDTEAAPSDSCLQKASDCLKCVKPGVSAFFDCASFPNHEQLDMATNLLAEEMKNSAILAPGRISQIMQLTQHLAP